MERRRSRAKEREKAKKKWVGFERTSLVRSISRFIISINPTDYISADRNDGHREVAFVDDGDLRRY